MNFLDLAKKRYSAIEYENKSIEKEQLEEILEAGMLAPTACNFQPQRIRVIESDEDKQKLAKVIAGNSVYGAALLVCYDSEECWTRSYDGKPSGEIDASIVTTHMMLEAADLGLGSIWVMHWDPQKMSEAFALSEKIVPVSLLILGHIKEGSKIHKEHFERKDISEVIL